MSDVFDHAAAWLAEGHQVALGRIVAVDGSAPRGAGAAMAVTEGHEVAGSISGGCVESALVESADGVLASGLVSTARYTPDDDGWSVGLTCGGTLDVVVEPIGDWPEGVLDALRADLAGGRPVALATATTSGHAAGALLARPDGSTVGTLGSPALDEDVTGQLAALLADGHETATTVAPGDVFVQTWVPPDRLVVFGAVDFTAALVQVAKVLGFHVTVCDARAVFATAERFPEADEVVVERPERLLAEIGGRLGPRDAVCVLTHDVKFDVPAIVGALATDVGYLGAMGSRKTHADRLARLREAGVDDEGLARLHSPIGLDIGGRTPGETAVSILAEIVASRSGTPGPTPSLRDTSLPIHR